MLGVCYYPEHWPREHWIADVKKMREIGIEYVRIGEFAWSRLEPQPGEYSWKWLDEALEVLGNAGLKVVLGTPTAAPPKWLIDSYPEILPVDDQGRVRKFGSRRHYCFSSPQYREEAARIVGLLAERYGNHPAVAGWQLDNEYGCHGTVRCYCPRCEASFRDWLEARYHNIGNLNRSWGNVFWSQEYGSFAEIDLPNLTVAEPNPSHVLDYYRFASDQVVGFNRMQAKIVRDGSQGKFVTHNFMGFFVDFDHNKVASDIDFPSWDNYPIGNTEILSLSEHGRYARTGHPDIAALNHDLYRGLGKGQFWVMEQQPGPVNWAPHNPSPVPGMVRLWTWEALAHGAEVVSFFRWRQAPFAQEQMHAGLLRPDSKPDVGYREVERVATEFRELELPAMRQAPVALVFDYEAAWIYEIQPQGVEVSYLSLVQRFYTSLRKLGLDVDILPPGEPLTGYKLVVVPSLPIVSGQAFQSFKTFEGPVVFGPRTGSKTDTFQIPPNLPPGPLQRILPLRVVRVESLAPGLRDTLSWHGNEYPVYTWKEWVETHLKPEGLFADGLGAVLRDGRYYYLAFWPSEDFLLDFFEDLARGVGLDPLRLPSGIRMQQRGELTFAFNFTGDVQQVSAPLTADFLLGEANIAPYGVSVWRSDDWKSS